MGMNSRTHSTQRGVGKVRKARAVVMILLVIVALAIVVIDKKEEPIEIVDGTQPNTAEELTSTSQESQTLVATTSTTSAPVVTMVSAATNSVPTIQKAVVSSPTFSQPPVVIAPKTTPILVKSSGNAIKTTPKVFIQAKSTTSNTSVRHTRTLAEAKRHHKISAPRYQPEEKAEAGYHIVAKGETLSSIALKHYGKETLWLALRRANSDIIRNARSLKIGQKIRVPSFEDISQYSKRSKHSRRYSPRHNQRRVYAEAYGDEVRLSRRTSSSGGYHVVSKGETLSGIAKRSGVGFLTLYDHNRGVLCNGPDFIKAGTKLWIPCR